MLEKLALFEIKNLKPCWRNWQNTRSKTSNLFMVGNFRLI